MKSFFQLSLLGLVIFAIGCDSAPEPPPTEEEAAALNAAMEEDMSTMMLPANPGANK